MYLLLYPLFFILYYLKYGFSTKYDSKLDKTVQMIIRKGTGVCAIRSYDVFHIKGHFYGIYNPQIYGESEVPCSRIADFQTLNDFDWQGQIYYKDSRPAISTILKYMHWKDTYFKSRLSIKFSAEDFEGVKSMIDLIELIDRKQEEPEDFLDKMLYENK